MPFRRAGVTHRPDVHAARGSTRRHALIALPYPFHIRIRIQSISISVSVLGSAGAREGVVVRSAPFERRLEARAGLSVRVCRCATVSGGYKCRYSTWSADPHRAAASRARACAGGAAVSGV